VQDNQLKYTSTVKQTEKGEDKEQYPK
jgi:hypothetical protein